MSKFVVLGVIAIVLAAIAGVMHGPKSALMVVVGVVATTISLVCTWLTIGWIGKLFNDKSPSWQGAVVPVAGMVIKLPVILVAMSWAQRLGPPAPAWFLAGLGLVYSGLVWWAVTKQ